MESPSHTVFFSKDAATGTFSSLAINKYGYPRLELEKKHAFDTTKVKSNKIETSSSDEAVANATNLKKTKATTTPSLENQKNMLEQFFANSSSMGQTENAAALVAAFQAMHQGKNAGEVLTAAQNAATATRDSLAKASKGEAGADETRAVSEEKAAEAAAMTRSGNDVSASEGGGKVSAPSDAVDNENKTNVTVIQANKIINPHLKQAINNTGGDTGVDGGMKVTTVATNGDDLIDSEDDESVKENGMKGRKRLTNSFIDDEAEEDNGEKDDDEETEF
jgi:hypothetical protein